jgi:hypothetical protein
LLYPIASTSSVSCCISFFLSWIFLYNLSSFSSISLVFFSKSALLLFVELEVVELELVELELCVASLEELELELRDPAAGREAEERVVNQNI